MVEKRIALIGAGQMGSALLKGILKAGVVSAHKVWVSDANRQKSESLKEECGVNVASDNRQAGGEADVIFLAVKPQQVEEVLVGLREIIKRDQLVISIAAGMSTETLEAKLGEGTRIIRVMPNSPALIGKSVSVISRGKHASKEDEQLAGRLFSSVGEVVFLDEEYQNKVTALSGSGPAYFYLMVEELIGAGEKMGLTCDTAENLVVGTIAGAAAMLIESGKSPAELRKMVTSPGGTTEAAIAVFKERDFSGMVKGAVEAAVKRAEELGG